MPMLVGQGALDTLGRWLLGRFWAPRGTEARSLEFIHLAAYLGVESVRDLLGRAEPAASGPGVVLAVMPVLARAKQGCPGVGSRAAVSEANQTWLCAWLSAVLLVGLAANAALRHCQVSTPASSSP